MKNRDLELGVIGNCTYGALIDRQAEVVWACMPRFDAEPIFSALLGGNEEDIQGTFAIQLEDYSHSDQFYLKNTAVLVTRLYDTQGNHIEVTDFAPRFKQYGRFHRPLTLMRKLEPHGSPRCKIIVRPAQQDGTRATQKVQGSNHIRFVADHWTMRLTTDGSITYILDETSFVLDSTIHLIFGQDESITEPIDELVSRFLRETSNYWMEWCRYLAIPYEWQDKVIRSAITLKMSAYEDTGAIIAALTTSIPEAANTTRNWDYRFCWLRDSYFTVNALNQLGVTGTMEAYLQYIVNIVASTEDDKPMQPVFCINGTKAMPERIVEDLPGYRGMGPVRIGNQAAQQIQHDVYGAVVLAAKQMFFDERIYREGDLALFHILEKVGERAKENYDKPDAGLWELRNNNYVHTFSSMMCWAATDRLARIALKLELEDRAEYWQYAADTIREAIDTKGFNKELNAYTATWGGTTMDASLLLACELGFVNGKDPRFVGTVNAIEKHLLPKGSRYLFRYVVEDDFGAPENAFTICSFWYIDALIAIGREDEARDLFEELLSKTNHVGLLSEDLDPKTGELWGNYPQTYSLVGIINSALRLSKSWLEFM
ncbi:Trehalase [Thalassocella blandensis]|nr:Trehalase [Thalassocella blandensis]